VHSRGTQKKTLSFFIQMKVYSYACLPGISTWGCLHAEDSPRDVFAGRLAVQNNLEQQAQAFISGNSEMAQCIRAFDWSTTPLGPMSSWSPELKKQVSMAGFGQQAQRKLQKVQESKEHEETPQSLNMQLEQALLSNEAWLAAQSEAFQAAINGAPLEISLGVLARTAIKQAGVDVRCGFYLADASKAELHHVVGMPETYAECVDGFKIGPDSLACGLAVYTGRPVITPDVIKEPRWQPWLSLAKKFEYRGCWSFPIETESGNVVGTFAMYFKSPREAMPRDYEFASVLTRAAAIIISRTQQAQERARADEALREAERRLSFVLETCHIGAWEMDIANHTTIRSPEHDRVYGYDRPLPQWTYEMFMEHVLPEDRQRVDATYQNAIKTQSSWSFEFRIRRRDGQIRWIWATGDQRRDADGEVRRVAGIVLDITERKQAEEAVTEARKSVEWERNLLQMVINGTRNSHLVYLDRNFNFVRVNEAYAKTCGYRPEEMIGKNHFALYPHKENEAIFARVRDTGIPAEFHDKPFVFPDQPERGVTYWDWTLVPVNGDTGKVEGLVFSLVETTERKQAEDHITQHNTMLAGINRILAAAVASQTEEDLGRTCLEVAEMLTQSKFGFIGELNAQGLEDVAISNPGWDACAALDPHGRRRPPGNFKIHGLYGRVLSSGESLLANDPAHHPDAIGLPPGHPPLESFLGVPLIYQERSIGMVAVANRQGGYTAYQQSILEALAPVIVEAFMRKRAEEALQQNEEQFRRAIEEAPIPIIMHAEDGEVLQISRTWTELTGYRKEDIRTFDEWAKHAVYGQDADEIRDYMNKLFSSSSSSREFTIRTKDGQTRYWNLNASSLGTLVNGKRFVVGMATDITQRKHAERELQELNQELEKRVQERTAVAEQRSDQLQKLTAELANAEQKERDRLAHLLHDHLQQLLAAAKMKASILRHELKGDAAKYSAEEVIDLLKQSIQCSRELSMELSPPALNEAGLASGLEWLVQWFKEKHDLEVLFTSSPVIKNNVPEHIRTFMFSAAKELLFNVVKHAGVSKAKLDLAYKSGVLSLSVKDRRVGGGAGSFCSKTNSFGLFSIQERVHLFGGELKLTASPAVGMTATVTIPVKLKQAYDVVPLRSRKKADQTLFDTAKKKIRVLIADDHLTVREGLATILSKHDDIEIVAQAADGQAAVDMTARHGPDIAILDVNMPKLNGIEAAQKISNRFPDIAIIGLSMHATADVEKAMKSAGAVAYCTKDAPPEQLMQAIRSAVIQSEKWS
jgi:PAS domain S-box-containing protein